MISNGVTLLNNALLVNSGISTPVQWNSGGRAQIVISGTVYQAQPGLNLQIQSPGSLGQWINVGSSFVSDQVYPFDSVPGNYRLANLSASSVVGINAVMVRVPY